MTDDDTPQESLEELAHQITATARAADDKTLEAAKLIGEAYRRVTDGEASGTTWPQWCQAHLDLSRSRIQELRQIAGSDDPAAELERIREQTRERVAKHRERARAHLSAPLEPGLPLRNGGSEEATSPGSDDSHPPARDPEPDELPQTSPSPRGESDQDASPRSLEPVEDRRQRLIAWVHEAPLEEVDQVLAYIETLASKAPDLDRAA